MRSGCAVWVSRRRKSARLREVFLVLFGKRQNLKLALDGIVSEKLTPEVQEMIDFIRASKRGVAFGPRDGSDW